MVAVLVVIVATSLDRGIYFVLLTLLQLSSKLKPCKVTRQFFEAGEFVPKTVEGEISVVDTAVEDCAPLPVRNIFDNGGKSKEEEAFIHQKELIPIQL